MSIVLWVAAAFVASYVMSYMQDVWPYVRKGLPLRASALRVWRPLLLSAVARATCLLCYFSAARTVVAGPSTPTYWATAMGAAFITTVGTRPYARFPLSRRRTAARPRGLAALLHKVEHRMWQCLPHDLSIVLSEEIRAFTATPERRLSLLIAYEESKETLVRESFDRGPSPRAPRWLYLALLTGDHNSMRAEAFVDVLGFQELKRRSREIEAHVAPSEVSTTLLAKAKIARHGRIDARDMPLDWKKWPRQPELFARHRRSRGTAHRRIDGLIHQLLHLGRQ